ncbi:MAG: FmdB family zinc ribbon protein [Gammaproteobacteria bacterium]
MPIYEYKCLKCSLEFEILQKIIEDPLKTCEACGGELKKQISAPAFRLKGSGWYETDFKTGNKKNISGSEDSSAGSNSKKDSGNDKVEKSPKENKQAG